MGSNTMQGTLVQGTRDAASRTCYLTEVIARGRGVRLPTSTPQDDLTIEPIALHVRARRAEDQLLARPWHPGEAPMPELPALVAHDLLAALSHCPNRQLLLAGEAGAGKTTLLRVLACRMAERALRDAAAPLPIYLSLAHLAELAPGTDCQTAWREALRAVAGEYGGDPAFGEELWSAVHAGHIVLCLDDASSASGERVESLLSVIVRPDTARGAAWVVAARTPEVARVARLLTDHAIWEVLPLERPDRLLLAERLLPAAQRLYARDRSVPPRAPDDFVRAIEAHAHASWQANPAVCTLGALAYARTGLLPSGRVALIGDVIECALDRVDTPERRTLLFAALGTLALAAHAAGVLTVPAADLAAALHDETPGATEHVASLAEMAPDTGLVERSDEGSLRFPLPAVSAYLAAAALGRRLTAEDESSRVEASSRIWAYALQGGWEDVLCLLPGALVHERGEQGTETALRWLESLLARHVAPEGDPGALALSLILEALAEIPRAPVFWEEGRAGVLARDAAGEWVTALLVAARAADEPTCQRLLALATAVSRLGSASTELATTQLLEALGSADWSARATAAHALGRLGGQVPVEPLVALLTDTEWPVRSAAIDALQACGDRVPVGALLAALRDPWIGEQAIQALAALGVAAPFERLVELVAAPRAETRVAALMTLKLLAEHTPVEPLVAALRDDAEPVRAAAALAIGALRARAPLDSLLGMLRARAEALRTKVAVVWALGALGADAPVQHLVSLLREREPALRCAAAETLAMPGVRAPGDRLLPLLRERDARIRVAAVRAIAALATGAPVTAFAAALGDPHPAVRAEAARALGRLAGDGEVGLLLAALGDDEAAVRAAAAEALCRIGERSIAVPAEPLLVALGDVVPAVRATVAAAVATCCQKSTAVAVCPLVGALRDESEAVRAAVARALGHLADRGAAGEILDALREREGSPEARLAAVAVLGALGQDAPVDQLAQVLARRDDWQVRAAVARALGHLGLAAPVETLVAAAHGFSPGVRAAAIEALGMLGPAAPLGELVGALGDLHPATRCAALHALVLRGEEAPVERMAALLRDREVEVRVAAVEAMAALQSHAHGQTAMRSIALALQDEQPEVRAAALRALGRQAQQAPVERMAAALADGTDGVRVAAVEALGALGDWTPVGMLGGALGDVAPEVRATAARALAAHGERVRVEWLTQALADPDAQVRAAAAEAIGHLEWRAPIQPLIDLLRGPERDATGEVCVAAACALARLGGEAATEAVRMALRSDAWQARVAAITALGSFSEHTSGSLLADALRDGTATVRAAAVTALAAAGATVPSAALAAALDDPAEEVREAAVRAMPELAVQSPASLLSAALGDESPGVRLAAAETLRLVVAPEAARPLLGAQGDGEPAVRAAALATLAASYPAALREVALEAEALLLGHEAGMVFGSLAQSACTEAIGAMQTSASTIVDYLLALLEWPFWEVRARAALALGRLGAAIPAQGIHRLVELRHDPSSRAVRAAAERALAMILAARQS